YLVTGRADGPPGGSFRPIAPAMVRNASGFDLFFGMARPAVDPDEPGAFEPYRPCIGVPRKVALAPGKYTLRIVSLFYAPFSTVITYPDPRLEPDPRALPRPGPSPDIDPFLLRPGP